MTEKEFLEIVSLHVETWYIPKKKIEKYTDDYYKSFRQMLPRTGKALKDINLDDCLLLKWMAGGVGGGNCWKDDDHYSIPAEPEPPFEDIDIIIEKVCPNLTYLQYKKLIPEIISIDTVTDYEYYGNSTNYMF